MALIISCNGLPGCVVGVPFSHFLSTNTPGTVFSIFNAFSFTNPPDGLYLNSYTGEIAGIPDTSGWTPAQTGANAAFYSMIIDAVAGSDRAQIFCGMGSFINCLPIIGTFNGPLTGSVGVPYNGSISALQGIAPYSFAVTSGSLPNGLSMDSSGNITGTPTLNGFYTAFVTITGAGSPVNNVQVAQVSIQIGGVSGIASQLYFIGYGIPPELAIECGGPPEGVVDIGYSALIPVVGGVPPFTFALTAGSLPTGLSLASTGVISGTPTGAGVYGFTVRVTDSAATSEEVTCSITINPAISLECGDPPSGSVGVPYTHTLVASGGVSPYTFAITAGTLPVGLTLDTATGEISGTPTVNGLYNFTVLITDSYAAGPDPNTAEVDCSILIEGDIAVSCNNPPKGNVGASYDHAFTVTGGAAPYVFSLAAGTLPPGLTLDPTTGELTGTPTVSGVYEFSIRATDADEAAGQTACSIVIKRCLLVDLT